MRKIMSEKVLTKTTTHDDGSFVRTALVIENDKYDNVGSIVLVNKSGKRIAMLNISYNAMSHKGEEYLIVDVIDVDRRFDNRRALGFSNTERTEMHAPKDGKLISVDFRAKQKE
jgi:hypothetical protein